MKKPVFCLFLSLCLSCLYPFGRVQLYAQPTRQVVVDPKVEAEFKQGLSAYLSQDYRAAFATFESLCNSGIIHQRMTGALLLAGKSLYKLQKYTFAIPYFTRLINDFPQSHYVDDAYYARAACEYQTHQYLKAARDLLWVVDRTRTKALRAKSRGFARHIMGGELSAGDLQRLYNSVNGASSSALVAITLAQKHLVNGEPRKAVSVLSSYKRKYPDGPYAEQVDRLLQEAKINHSPAVRVGVVLPLSGLYGDIGVSILKGIRFAQQEFEQKNGGQHVDLLIRDSEGNMIKAIHAVKKLMHREHAKAIIGDLESSVTAGIGALAATEEVTLLGPAATENAVASVGETVFQLNSDLEQKGRALAEYAFNQLGLRTFATLAPADDYGQQITSSFTSRIDELGGRIISQQWFFSDAEEGLDLNRQFQNIREAAFSYDSTDVETMIAEARAKGEDLDERDIPVLSVDGIFLPVYSEDLPYVAPQFALANIRSQILGGEYWDDVEMLTRPQVQKYIEGVIFVSDFFPDEGNGTFRRFRTEFRLRLKTTPERWEVFGYDAMSLIGRAIKEGAQSGFEIAQKLNDIADYQGMKGLISFKGNNRVNSEVNFLQFVKGKIIKHQQ